MAFGGMGNAGGLEAIASGAAREQFRRNLLNSAGNAWKEGAKALGVNLLGEMTEEQFIGALDLAFVQMEIRPGMNTADMVGTPRGFALPPSPHDSALSRTRR
jgi:hypothetical protein